MVIEAKQIVAIAQKADIEFDRIRVVDEKGNRAKVILDPENGEYRFLSNFEEPTFGFDTEAAASEWRKVQMLIQEFNKKFPQPGTIQGYGTFCWSLAGTCEQCFRKHGVCGMIYDHPQESSRVAENEQIRKLFKKVIAESPELARSIAGE